MFSANFGAHLLKGTDHHLNDWVEVPEMSWDIPLPYAILLQDKVGKKETKSFLGYGSSFADKHVLRGELLLRLSKEEVRYLKQQDASAGLPPVNFKFFKDQSVKIYCDAHVVHLLNYEQKELLAGISSPFDRFKAIEKLDWAEKLAKGSVVYVAIKNVPTAAKGVVRYIGKLPGQQGTHFGVELNEYRGEGTSDGHFQDDQFFECDMDCAVFVLLDKLSDKPVDVNITPSGSGGSHDHKPEKKLHHQKSVERYQERLVPPKTGERVVAFDNKGVSVAGIVKWIGATLGTKAKVVGIETDVPVNSKDFSDSFSGMNLYFTPSHRRGKEYQLFLPFTAILKEEAVHSQENNTSITTQVAMQLANEQKESPEVVKEQQAKAFEKEKAKTMLKLDDKDIDDTMSTAQQKKILEEIQKNRKNQNNQQGGQSGQFPGTEQNFSQPTNHHQHGNPLHPHNQGTNAENPHRAAPNVLRAGDMEPVRQTQPPHVGGAQNGGLANEQWLLNQRYQQNLTGRDEPLRAHTSYPQGYDNQVTSHVLPTGRGQQGYGHDSGGPTYPTNSAGSAYPPNSGTPHYSGGSEYSGGPGCQAESRQLHDSRGVGYSQNMGGDQFQHLQAQQNARGYPPAGGGGYPPAGGGGYPPAGGGGYPPAGGGGFQQPYRGDPDYGHNDPNYRPDVYAQHGGGASGVDNLNPYNLEIGCVVQLGDPPRYGVIKWIDNATAGVEMDRDGNGLQYVPLSHLRPDAQYMQRAHQKVNPLQRYYYEHDSATAKFVQAPTGLDISKHTGIKGIQGQQNSCYLDATLYGMFAFSDVFDAMFLEKKTEDHFELKIKTTLERKIVNPLRMKNVVVQDAILGLRNELSTLQQMKGLTSDEKDPEEFLNLLFKHVLHVDPFLVINRPSGTDKEFFVQLFVEPDQSVSMPETYWLIHKMFKEQKITFKEYPQRLLLQIPRYGKQFKAFDRVKPTLKLVLNTLCDGYAEPCFVCGGAGKVLCDECCQLTFLKDKNGLYFCEGCSQLWHSHLDRRSHKPIPRGGNDEGNELELLSVLCIETSHYVCFTRITGSGKDQWVFFDSMATRTDDEYNLPRVTDCTDDINNWVYGDKDISKTPSKELPELVRRFVGDPYLCIYTEFGGSMYG